MKMNHNYETYLSLRFAPPPCEPHTDEVLISKEEVDPHLPSSKEGVL